MKRERMRLRGNVEVQGRSWFKFSPSKWMSDPDIRSLSIEARGLFFELLNWMHGGDDHGRLAVNGRPLSIEQISCLASLTVKGVETLLASLINAGLLVPDRDGVLTSDWIDWEGYVRPPPPPNWSAIRRRIYDRDGGICGYCGHKLALDGYTVDHVHPLALGGSDEESNLTVACRPCNSSKRDRLV